MAAAFYTLRIEESDGGTFRLTVAFDAGHAVFAGHFPGKPVVPGVFMTEILRDSVNILKSKKYRLTELASVKFLNVIDPEESPEVTLSGMIVEGEDGKLNVSAQFGAGDVIFARMKGIQFTPAE